MSSTRVRSSSHEARPRHSVRIVKKRIPSRAAALSLAAVALTAVFSFAAWRWWRSDTIVPPAPPTLAEVELDWRCSAGHLFTAPGQAGSRLCPQCSEQALPIATYYCDKHGPNDVEAEFERDAAGRMKIVKFRVKGGEWVEAGDGPHCPRCGAVMERRQDPLAGLVRPKRKSGG